MDRRTTDKSAFEKLRCLSAGGAKNSRQKYYKRKQFYSHTITKSHHRFGYIHMYDQRAVQYHNYEVCPVMSPLVCGSHQCHYVCSGPENSIRAQMYTPRVTSTPLKKNVKIYSFQKHSAFIISFYGIIYSRYYSRLQPNLFILWSRVHLYMVTDHQLGTAHKELTNAHSNVLFFP